MIEGRKGGICGAAGTAGFAFPGVEVLEVCVRHSLLVNKKSLIAKG